MRSALIPGSFDPVTRGHADVIRRVAAHFDRVYVAVMHNDMNRYVAGAAVKQYLFSAEERVQMVRLACTGLENVEVFADGGLLIDLVDRLGVDWIVMGIRSEEDYRYEQCHALWNRAHNPRAETLYLPTDPAFADVSSTLVRAELAAGRVPDELLPTAVAAYIRETCPPAGQGAADCPAPGDSSPIIPKAEN